MSSDETKDASVMAARLLCTAHAATAAVFFGESWMAVKHKGESVVQPSKDPTREEVVMILGETYERAAHRFLPILRTPSGAFRALGNDDHASGSVQGRFTRLLPTLPLTPEIQAEAKALVAALGIETQEFVVPSDHAKRA